MKRTGLQSPCHFCVHHKTVFALVQEMQLLHVPFVRVQPLEREIRGFRVWGVLVTARLVDEVHIAWVKVREARFYTPALHEQAVATQAAVVQHIHHLAIQAGLEVYDGWYAVVPEILLYREPADWPLEQEGN